MKRPDLMSSVVAGFVGSIALLFLVMVFDKINATTTPLYPSQNAATWLMLGFLTGMVVQVGVRTTGVS
jgi:hypothetical protein